MGESLLFKRYIEINDKIRIKIPSVGEVIDNENEYYGLVSLFTAMPYDLMAQLDELKIDFTTINEYELFLIFFRGIQRDDTSLIFDGIDLKDFEIAIDDNNNQMVLLDREHDIVIDRAIHAKIANALRNLHHLEKNMRKPGNEEAKKFLLERAKAKLRRGKRKLAKSQLESIIVAMVNTEQYKYDFEGTRELSIYQFNESVDQVIHKVDYDNRMYGVYAGTVDATKLSQKDLNWLQNK